MDKVPASPVTSGMHIEADTEHFSHRDGTLLVGANFDKTQLGKHDIEKIDTHTLDHLKKTADGRTILIPQPTDDPLQSLNWSWRKKHIVLFVLTYCTLMTDMSSAWSIPLVITQAEYWGISPSNAGRNLSGNIFMLGVGGIAAVPATRWLGRLPVLFWSMTIALFMSVFAAAAPGWISYIVARCLLGFFVTAPQVVGLSMLHDMFFFHEHARKIGIWAGTFIFSPYLGPFLSGIINNYCGWRVSTWVCVAMQGVGVILVILLADETYYDSGTSKRYTADVASGKSKWRIQCEKLVGVTGYQAHYKGVGKTMTALLIMVLRPHFVALCFFYLLTFAWSIGLNTTLTLFLAPPPPEGYGYSSLTIALFYISPMIAAVVGELFGHWFNDFIANRHIRASGGTYEPEVRLWTVYISTAFLIGGLVFYGFGIERHMQWIALIMAWAMYSFGIVTATVAITAYGLDIFPHHGVEAAAIINMFRTSGGFIVNYFQVDWALKSGGVVSFGTEAGIVAAAFLLVVAVQLLGSKSRAKFHSPPKYEH
ncbi:hypothetical protein H2202_002224 [Exophiala xenobiotica]|nr:hypothetical protein H2202_002224 [Exophiala xenobiotica]KAK5261023.1 hypothetical protein LTR40_003004 [Exophiala xenobiotica]KAK5349535.1 hypothetical protein LTR61_006925 [Exophiala xenobiotica]KAK5376671.1 hypothetical protein LTS03_005440 [Exophiala xenobiotica]KAK5489278.1 hypothetical protein LTR26_004597 [Exophiala xenobiotica]